MPVFFVFFYFDSADLDAKAQGLADAEDSERERQKRYVKVTIIP